MLNCIEVTRPAHARDEIDCTDVMIASPSNAPPLATNTPLC
jgi:hypothetical protein